MKIQGDPPRPESHCINLCWRPACSGRDGGLYSSDGTGSHRRSDGGNRVIDRYSHDVKIRRRRSDPWSTVYSIWPCITSSTDSSQRNPF